MYLNRLLKKFRSAQYCVNNRLKMLTYCRVSSAFLSIVALSCARRIIFQPPVHKQKIKRVGFVQRQAGVSLPAILVIIIVMGIISAALVNLTASSQLEVGNDVISLRAFLAAEAGAQNGMARLFPLNGGAANCTAFNVNFAAAALNGCTASVTCAGPVTFNGRNMYTLASTGQCTLGNAISVRTLQVGARSP